MNNFLEALKKITFKKFNTVIYLQKYKLYNINYNNISKIYIKSKNMNDVEFLCNGIKKYITTMEKECSRFDPTIFTYNIKRTFFNVKNIKYKNISGTTGMVTSKKHLEFTLKSSNALNHELMHLSSTKTGFGYSYLKPFDEGYTQLLAERYFNEGVGQSYRFEVDIMSEIEGIFGKDYLEKRYFKGELIDIVNELYKYTNYSKANKLISNINLAFYLEQNSKNIDFSLIDNISNTLQDIRMNKLSKKELVKDDNLNLKFM